MGLFQCKHKEYRVIACNKKDRFYFAQCVKCGHQWKMPKAEGEEYNLTTIIRRS